MNLPCGTMQIDWAFILNADVLKDLVKTCNHQKSELATVTCKHVHAQKRDSHVWNNARANVDICYLNPIILAVDKIVSGRKTNKKSFTTLILFQRSGIGLEVFHPLPIPSTAF